jgi:hypothetical protein
MRLHNVTRMMHSLTALDPADLDHSIYLMLCRLAASSEPLTDRDVLGIFQSLSLTAEIMPSS